MLHTLYRRNPQGKSWLAILLTAAAVLFFGNMLLRMFIRIAFGAIALAVNVIILMLIIIALFYVIKMVSQKTETK